VEEVAWLDATNYCAQLTVRERMAGRLPVAWTYRLPTEAEWEYAYRAGSTTRYYFGADPSLLGSYAWYSANGSSTTHTVGGREPNAWGLYDMSGNVWEWCQDWWGGLPGGNVTDPQGPSSGSYRVLHGGSFHYDASLCAASSRHNAPPSYRSHDYGFRVVLAPVQ
jgi:formylglycine-generating enzyme required for sulfatase activity